MFHHVHSRTITEAPVAGRRLGRHVEHDPRSKTFPAARAGKVGGSAIGPVTHRRHSHVLDQGQLGSCTGNAMTGMLGTDPWYIPNHHPTDNETLAVELYGLATHLDTAQGSYPPDDTGSSGLAVAKAAQQLGLIKQYAHCFGLQHALETLMLNPVIVGVNWYDSFDEPDEHGIVSITAGASVRGGHEFELIGIPADNQTMVEAVNSWGASWGRKGHFFLSFDTLGRLLDEEGDCTAIAA